MIRRELLETAFSSSGSHARSFEDRIVEKYTNKENLTNNSASKEQYNVLLVEDTLANQKLATVMLRQLGYNTDLAENGQKAVAMCNIKNYDIILMDCQMPLMDGYEASSIIKKSKGLHRDTVIIAMTAHAMEGDRDKCINAGMDDYFSKPINMNKLDKILKKWL
ncbi:MAG: response regulator [Desulfosporosinus sp.]|nr:response regulator [Desulfosporosinus sp.]